MRYSPKRVYLLVLLVLATVLVGCGPEAGRPRGAGFGSGADVDNHPPADQMRPRSKVFPAESKP